MQKYVITSDSTCDLTQEQIAEYGVVIKALTIVLDGKEYSDNVDINVEQVLAHVDNGGDLPKTAATSIEEYKEFFDDEQYFLEIIPITGFIFITSIIICYFYCFAWVRTTSFALKCRQRRFSRHGINFTIYDLHQPI